MKKMRFPGGRIRLAGAVLLVSVTTLLFASVATAQSSPSQYPPPPPSPIAPPEWEGPLMPFVGDANLTGAVTPGDASAILLHMMTPGGTLSPSALAAADTYGRGYVTSADASHILQYAMDPAGTLGVLVQPLWDWDLNLHHSLRDPLGQNAG